MEIVQGITEAAKEANSPVILQVSAGARKYAKHTYLMKLVEAAVQDTGLPMALHLDHGEDFEICKACIDGGFTSVMIDGSKHSFEDNIALTRRVVEYAHAHDVVVEGELGRLAGIEDDVNVSAEESSYTNPEQVEEFVRATGVDSLAIAIGTSHGAFKFKPGTKPQLRFDILEEVSKRLRQAARMAVCKINIDSDLRLAMTAGVRQQILADPAGFDPRGYLKVGRQYVKDLVKDKIINVLGSDGKA